MQDGADVIHNLNQNVCRVIVWLLSEGQHWERNAPDVTEYVKQFDDLTFVC